MTSARVHKIGDHIDTDVILPGKYLTFQDPELLGPHCLEGVDPDFASRVSPGDILVAGRNFGCGSSREHAPIAIKASGIACIVARSYARIFYRNAINIGLPVLICPEFVDAVEDGDEVDVDPLASRLAHAGKAFEAEPLAEVVRMLVKAGGMVPYVQAQLAKRA